jgi:hypothetical protein
VGETNKQHWRAPLLWGELGSKRTCTAKQEGTRELGLVCPVGLLPEHGGNSGHFGQNKTTFGRRWVGGGCVDGDSPRWEADRESQRELGMGVCGCQRAPQAKSNVF